MNNFNEEKKPKKFKRRVKKHIALGVLSAAAITGITFGAIRLSHQEKTGKVIPINYRWDVQHLEGEKAKEGAKFDFVYAVCTALIKYRDDLKALVKDPNTDWANRKETIFALPNLKDGTTFIGGDNYTSKINSAKEAQEVIEELNAYLDLSAKQYGIKLRFEFKNPFLREILRNVRKTLEDHGIPWQK
ncbi:hypothetical protein [Mycoplasma todarodis]|uniref:hypothetical protein n=1 Tax=Mycoplasma todarodis TaxID=1937191 RepID=UPI003B32FAB2